MHVIAAKAAAFEEALKPNFIEYSKQTLSNAKALCISLKESGFKVVSGDTSCHMILVDLTNKNISGKIAEESLDRAGITCNKNSIPFDTKSPFVTSGIRVGTAAGTTRGFMEREFSIIGGLISEVVDSLSKGDAFLINKVETQVREKVANLCKQFPIY